MIDVNDEPVLEPSNTEFKLYIPLTFYFNRNPGLALPIVAIPFSDGFSEIDSSDNENYYYVKTLFGENIDEDVAPKSSLIIDRYNQEQKDDIQA